MRRTALFACGAVLLVACAAIAAHAADAPAPAANKPAANKPAANAAKPAAANAAAAAKPAANAPAANAAAKPAKSGSDSGKKKAAYSGDDDDPTPNGKDKYDKYEQGSGSDKGAKLKWKYLSPTIDAVCLNPGTVCAPGICDVVQIECAPGSVCTPICNNCQATCAAPLTCTGGGLVTVLSSPPGALAARGALLISPHPRAPPKKNPNPKQQKPKTVKCPKYFQCEVGSITGNDDDTDAYVRCVPATSSVPTTCALGYVRVAATGACVRPSILKVQGGNILSITTPATAVLKKPERREPNQVSSAKKEEEEEKKAANASGAKEPSRKQVEEEGAKKAADNKKAEEKKQ
jgi:hypothetical protein